MAKQGVNFAKQTTAFREKQKQKQLLKNVVLSLILIGLALGAWVAVFVYKKSYESKLADVKKQIEMEKNKRDFNNIASVLDTANRLDYMGDLRYRQNMWSGTINEIKSRMLKSAYIERFEGSSEFYFESELEENTGKVMPAKIEFEMIVPTLTDVSRQIVSFEESDIIEGMTVESIDLKDAGITFMAQLRIIDGGLNRINFTQEENEELDAEEGAETGGEENNSEDNNSGVFTPTIN